MGRLVLPLATGGADPVDAVFLKLSPERPVFFVASLFVGASANAPWARRCLVDNPLPELIAGGAGLLLDCVPREEAEPLR